MSDDFEARLRDLAEKLGPPVLMSPTPAAITHDADLQAAATLQADVLLRRVAALTDILKLRAGAWDALDDVSSRMLLSDLAILTAWWRGLGSLTSARLESAGTELRAALHAADRTLKSE